MKNKLIKLLVAAMSLITAFSVTACVNGPGNGGDGKDRVKIEFRANISVDAKIPYILFIDWHILPFWVIITLV